MSFVRAQLLREMGLSVVWRLRSRRPAGDDAMVDQLASTEPTSEAAPQAGAIQPDAAKAGAPDVPMPAQARSTAPHSQPQPQQAPDAASAVPDAARADYIAGLDWDALEAEIKACRACNLCEQRRQAVPGHGDHHARWLFVGEGPGAEEDRQGLPFVGAAGQLLDAMLESIGLNRYEQVFIANAVKCRPPMNRTPNAEEMAVCRPYLQRQIELIGPQVIVALGRPAAQTLLETEIRIGAARGKTYDFQGIPVVVTYHPAYLLRNQHDKRKVWADLLFAREVVEGRTEPADGARH